MSNLPFNVDFSSADYNTKFQFRNGFKTPLNLVGYGVPNPYRPPLQIPQTAITALDKLHVLLNSIMYSWMYLGPFLMGIGTGDSRDFYWYNNNEAIGNQLYPTGLHKYYDMFSARGWMVYLKELFLACIFWPF